MKIEVFMIPNRQNAGAVEIAGMCIEFNPFAETDFTRDRAVARCGSAWDMQDHN